MKPFSLPADLDHLARALEDHFGSDASYGIEDRPGDQEDDDGLCARFPDGGHAAICTNYAVAVFRELADRLDCKLVWIDKRDSAGSEIVCDHESHDFCLVGGRFIVDAWSKNTEAYIQRAVLDTESEDDRLLIARVYGPVAAFRHNSGLEKGIRERMRLVTSASLARGELKHAACPHP